MKDLDFGYSWIERAMRFIAIPVALFVLAAAMQAAGQARDEASRYDKILDANTLDHEGKTPFHIKISFQLYDLDGKPTDTGDVEEWWAAPGQSKVMIEASSLKTPGPVPFDQTLVMDPRERYLVQTLLDAELHPVPRFGPKDQAELKVAPRTFGSATLDCLAVPPTGPEGSGSNSLSFCVDPPTDALRIDFEAHVSTTTRNETGTFHGTKVSLNVEIAFEKRIAITGKVALLQAFDPSTSDVKLSTPRAEGAQENRGSHVTAGKIKSKFPPVFPDFAFKMQASGTVILHGTITKEGKVKDVFAVASPNVVFTHAAVDALKQWTYEPYLLDGQPVEVESVFNLNFNFGARH